VPPNTGSVISSDPRAAAQAKSIGATIGGDGWWYKDGKKLSTKEADRLTNEAGTAITSTDTAHGERARDIWGRGSDLLSKGYAATGLNKIKLGGTVGGFLERNKADIAAGAAGLVGGPMLAAAVKAGLEGAKRGATGMDAAKGAASGYMMGNMTQGAKLGFQAAEKAGTSQVAGIAKGAIKGGTAMKKAIAPPSGATALGQTPGVASLPPTVASTPQIPVNYLREPSLAGMGQGPGVASLPQTIASTPKIPVNYLRSPTSTFASNPSAAANSSFANLAKVELPPTIASTPKIPVNYLRQPSLAGMGAAPIQTAQNAVTSFSGAPSVPNIFTKPLIAGKSLKDIWGFATDDKNKDMLRAGADYFSGATKLKGQMAEQDFESGKQRMEYNKGMIAAQKQDFDAIELEKRRKQQMGEMLMKMLGAGFFANKGGSYEPPR